MSLSSDQIVALNEVQNFLKFTNNEETKHKLTGGPGNGKSYLIAQIIKNNPNINIILAALTHQAANVLREMSSHIEVFTLHNILSLMVRKDWVTNKTETIPIKKRHDPLDVCDFKKTLVIVDESSMIDKITNNTIDIKIKKYEGRLKFLFVGDQDQLPSVEEGSSIIFDDKRILSSELTTIHRQGSTSTIPDEAAKLRKVIRSESYLMDEIEPSKNIHFLDYQDFLDTMQATFCTADMLNNIESVKAVAYHNKTSKDFNKLIRSYFFSHEQLQPKETVVLNKAFNYEDTIVPTESHMKIIKNEFLRNYHGVQGRLITADFEGNVVQGVYTEDTAGVNRIRRELKNERNYTKLKSVMESFIDVRPIFASTIHKAQGSTFDNVFIHLEDVCECHDYFLIPRLIYVALTRARKNVYFYGDIPNKLLKAY